MAQQRTRVEELAQLLVITRRRNEGYSSKSYHYQKNEVKKKVDVYIGDDSSCEPVYK